MGVPKEVICTLLFFAVDGVSNDYYAAISESGLLGEGVRFIVPAGLKQLGQYVFTTGVRFGGHDMYYTGRRVFFQPGRRREEARDLVWAKENPT
jgi:hypothetical protein